MPRTARLLIAVLCLFAATANGRAAETSLDAERARFLEAEAALKQNQRARFETLQASLRDYPLYPYLEYADLRRHLTEAKSAQIDHFLSTHDDTPLAPLLRAAWLQQLAQRSRWNDYLHAYQPQSDTALRCYHHWALYKTGRKDTAFQGVEELWLTGKLQPPACASLFNAWQKEGGLARELIWTRIRLAMEAGESPLARYLGSLLPAGERPWVDAWSELHEHPRRVTTHPRLAKDHPLARPLVLHAITRLARTDALEAARTWHTLKNRYAFTEEQRAGMEQRLALALARGGEAEGLRQLTDLTPAADDPSTREWRIRAALGLREWGTVLTWIEHLPEADRNSHRWRYWRARALEALAAPEASEIYAQLAQSRSYYGFLSADKLDTRYVLQNRPVPASKEELAAVEKLPGLLRAHELYLLGRGTEARREWRFTTSALHGEQRAAAAKIAQNWGWHDRAILTLADTPYQDDLQLRFPTPYRNQLMVQANSHEVDPAWAFAVMRQESAFMEDARSPAGALGLMQLMPATARAVARSLNTRLAGMHQLFDADTNIRFGVNFLRTVLDEFNGHTVLATAAYNAGGQRVTQWLPPEQKLDADIWVETVPFTETREYLQNVLAFTVIYDTRLGRTPVPLSIRMPPIPARDATLSQDGKQTAPDKRRG